MKYFITVILIFLLSGCATVSMTKTGEDVTWSSRTLFKDIEAVDALAAPDNFNFSLGSSAGSLSDSQAQALMCVLTGACK